MPRDVIPDVWFEPPPLPAYKSCRRCGETIGNEATYCKECFRNPNPNQADVAWMADGICAQVDPDLWHPRGKGGHDGSTAKRICNGYNGAPPCPVLDTCREYAITRYENGIWGGTSDRDRERIRRQRREGGVAA